MLVFYKDKSVYVYEKNDQFNIKDIGKDELEYK
jgi:hypothetical protein